MSVTEFDTRIHLAQPIGAPTEYKARYAKEVRGLCLLGAKDAEIANQFGIDVNTLYDWRDRYPDFGEAIKDGRMRADAHTAESLYHRANGASHKATKMFLPPGSREPVIVEYMEHLPPDTAAAFIWLKNRRPQDWRDKKEIDVNMTVENRLSPEVRAVMELMVDALGCDTALTMLDITPSTDDPTKE